MTVHETPQGCLRDVFTLKDFKSSVEPIWCSGCGDFGVLQAIQRALAEIGRPPHEVAVVSGIGCSSRLPAYTTAYGFHGVHGRFQAALGRPWGTESRESRMVFIGCDLDRTEIERGLASCRIAEVRA